MTNTITIILNASGSLADVEKDFTLYQGQFQSKLLDVLVPTSILAPQYNIQHYIGQMNGSVAPTDELLNAYVEEMADREQQNGDVIEFYNTSDSTYWLYVYTNNEWTSTQVDSFGTMNTFAGTSVKIGMLATQRNGIIYESKSYFMRFLTTITKEVDGENVEYALYERQLPQEFTTFAGQGTNAPKLVCNVVNVNSTNDEVISLITTQTCSLDVMPSTSLDNDEPIEADELTRLEADINTLAGNLEQKQDKVDDRLTTTSKQVVGAINELDSENTTNQENIADNTQNIVNLKTRVATLEENQSTNETFIGTMTGTSLPTNEQLNEFVMTKVGREPQANDVINFTLIVSQGTDKNYKCKYSSATQIWDIWEIPAVESANNENKGIVQGSYNPAQANEKKTQISIIGGEIDNVYVTDNNGTQRQLAEYINADNQTLNGIVNGTTAIGLAERAEQDGNGNNIVNTYMTQNAGATKQELKNYALPRSFNDVSYLAYDNVYGDTILDTPTALYQVTTSSVGDAQFFYADKTYTNSTFQLARKNSYTNSLFISTSVDCQASFRLLTQAYVNGVWELLNAELTEPINFVAGTIKKVVFGSTLNYIDNVITITEGSIIRLTVEVVTTTSTPITFGVYSNETYPSTFYLNTTSQIIEVEQGYLGEIPHYSLGGGTLSNDTLNFDIPLSVDVRNNVMALLTMSFNGAIPNGTAMTFTYNGQTIQIITPYNFGTNADAKVSDFNQMYHSNDTTNVWDIYGVFHEVGADIVFQVVGMENLQDIKDDIDGLQQTTNQLDADKQNKLTAGENISIEIDPLTQLLTISAKGLPKLTDSTIDLTTITNQDGAYYIEATNFAVKISSGYTYTIGRDMNGFASLSRYTESYNSHSMIKLSIYDSQGMYWEFVRDATDDNGWGNSYALSNISQLNNFLWNYTVDLTSYVNNQIYFYTGMNFSVTYNSGQSISLNGTGVGVGYTDYSTFRKFSLYMDNGEQYYFEYDITNSTGTYTMGNIGGGGSAGIPTITDNSIDLWNTTYEGVYYLDIETYGQSCAVTYAPNNVTYLNNSGIISIHKRHLNQYSTDYTYIDFMYASANGDIKMYSPYSWESGGITHTNAGSGYSYSLSNYQRLYDQTSIRTSGRVDLTASVPSVPLYIGSIFGLMDIRYSTGKDVYVEGPAIGSGTTDYSTYREFTLYTIKGKVYHFYYNISSGTGSYEVNDLTTEPIDGQFNLISTKTSLKLSRPILWQNIELFCISSNYIWTDGSNIYFSVSSSDGSKSFSQLDKNIRKFVIPQNFEDVSSYDFSGYNVWHYQGKTYVSGLDEFSNALNLELYDEIADGGKSSNFKKYFRDKTWSGFTPTYGGAIWLLDGKPYYSSGANQYSLDGDTWTAVTWNGSFVPADSKYIWSDGRGYYYSHGSDQYVLQRQTNEWVAMTWTGLTSFDGDNIWTDGEDIYCSMGSSHYVLDITNATWSSTSLFSFDTTYVTNGNFYGGDIWTDGENIYMQDDAGNQWRLLKNLPVNLR